MFQRRTQLFLICNLSTDCFIGIDTVCTLLPVLWLSLFLPFFRRFEIFELFGGVECDSLTVFPFQRGISQRVYKQLPRCPLSHIIDLQTVFLYEITVL